MSDQPVAPSSVASAGRPVPHEIAKLIDAWRDEAVIYRAAAKDQITDHDAAGAHVNCRRADDADRHARELLEAAVGSRLPPQEGIAVTLTEADVEGLRQFIDWHGPLHGAECPADDTCDCLGKPANDAVNAICQKAFDAQVGGSRLPPPQEEMWELST